MKETVFYCGADLFVEFEVVVEDNAEVFCTGMDVAGEGAQGVDGGSGGVSEDNDFGFIVIQM